MRKNKRTEHHLRITRFFLATGLFLLGVATHAATLSVTNSADSGAGSLRQAIVDAGSGDTITFDAALNGSVITLTSGQLSINKSLTIQGPGPKLLAINGNGASRIAYFSLIDSGSIAVTFTGLMLTNGVAQSDGGGAIYSCSTYTPTGTLTLSNCVVSANSAGTDCLGGGIRADQAITLRMYDCEVSDNESGDNGGGVWLRGRGTFERCAFINNTTKGSGGGLLIRYVEPVTIVNCTFSGNAAASGLGDNVGGGGGLYSQENGSVYISNSTFTGNVIEGGSAKHKGGGIYSYNNNKTINMVLRSTVVSGNQGNTHGYDDVAGLFTGVTNCLITVTNGVALPGENNIFERSAHLDALADNGGLTRTHALLSASPTIDTV